MASKLSKVVLALALVVVTLPAVAGAQDDSKSGESNDKENQTTESADSKADGGEESEKPTTEKSAKKGEASEKSTNDKAADGKETKKAKKTKGSEKGKQPKTGPGGKKLRSDYPGTKEAMKRQMDTDRIEGLQFKEGEEPAQAYDVEIQELETKIDDLKEKVFQSKSRVVLLKETVLGGNLSGSRAMIVHDDKLGGKFQLRRAMYSLDGNRVFNESSKTGDVSKKKFKVYDGSITAGSHNVSVLLEYQGNGYGVFNYMKGYHFKITSSCQFKAEAGKATVLKVRSVNKAGALSDVTKQPGIRCKITTRRLSDEKTGKPGDGSKGASDSAEEGKSKGEDSATSDAK